MPKPKKSRLWTNADLREWFDIYNERYFGGKLESITIDQYFWLMDIWEKIRLRENQQCSITLK